MSKTPKTSLGGVYVKNSQNSLDGVYVKNSQTLLDGVYIMKWIEIPISLKWDNLSHFSPFWRCTSKTVFVIENNSYEDQKIKKILRELHVKIVVV